MFIYIFFGNVFGFLHYNNSPTTVYREKHLYSILSFFASEKNGHFFNRRLCCCAKVTKESWPKRSF